MSPSPQEVVLGFLLDVRSGERLQRAGDYPGAGEMLDAVGPWTVEVDDPAERAGLVEAAWRQPGRVVEHGRARYRVRNGRITEYWIEFHRDEGALR